MVVGLRAAFPNLVIVFFFEPEHFLLREGILILREISLRDAMPAERRAQSGFLCIRFTLFPFLEVFHWRSKSPNSKKPLR